MRARIRLELETPAQDDTQSSASAPNTRLLRSAIAVVRARPDDVLAARPERASRVPDQARRLPVVPSERLVGADRDVCSPLRGRERRSLPEGAGGQHEAQRGADFSGAGAVQAAL